MENTAAGSPKYLQYVFFMNETQRISPCDEAGEAFLQSIDIEAFRSHLLSISLNTTNTVSTLIINNSSYSLRIIPVQRFSTMIDGGKIPTQLLAGHIVVLQCQPFLSSVILQMNQEHFDEKSYEKIFEEYQDGIFLTKSDGIVLYVNEKYESITGISRDELIGNDVETLSSQGMFTPAVSPVVLRTKSDYTIFQSFETGRLAIIAGSPVYDPLGNIALVLIFATPLTNEALFQIPRQFLSSFKKKKPQAYADTQIDIIAQSLAMKLVIQDVIKVAQYDVPVLFQGESGTGKEVLSSILHATSSRRYQPFIKVNCGAFPPTLLEAELFGYEAGAFTGASSKGKAGLFESANNGTILLDEIGEMPLASQTKFLRVLQNGEVFRVGGWKPISINTRIIAATNQDLKKMVEEGTFRRDLYYRLNVISMCIPSLRDRKEDIAVLLQHFCYIFNRKYHTNKRFSPECIDVLTEYPWPGNVRELKNLVERMVILCMDEVFYPSHFYKLYSSELQAEQIDAPSAVTVNGLPNLADAVSEVERTVVQRALEKGGNTRRAAKLIGVSQSTIMRKIKEYSLGARRSETQLPRGTI